MALLDDAAEWIDELPALERTDTIDAGPAPTYNGKANAQPRILGRRSRYLKELLEPIAASITRTGSLLQLLHPTRTDLKGPLVRMLTEGNHLLFKSIADGFGVGSIAVGNPIVGVSESGQHKPYGVHGALDFDVNPSSGVTLSPMQVPASLATMGSVRIVETDTPLTSTLAILPPAAPSGWDRAYFKVVTNTLNVALNWGSDVQRAGSTVLYLRGPGTSDWIRVGSRTDSDNVAQAGTLSVTSTTYANWVTATIAGKRGDIIDVSFGGELAAGTSTSELYNVNTELVYPGGGLLVLTRSHTLTQVSRHLCSRFVTQPLTETGDFTARIQVAKAAAPNLNALAQRGWISWKRTR